MQSLEGYRDTISKLYKYEQSAWGYPWRMKLFASAASSLYT